MEKVFVKSEPIWEFEDIEASDIPETKKNTDNMAIEQENNTRENIYVTVKIEPEDENSKNTSSSDNINDTLVLKTEGDINKFRNTAPKLESDASSVTINYTDVRKTETDCCDAVTKLENNPTVVNINATWLETRVDTNSTEKNASSDGTNDTDLLKTEPNHCNAKLKLENYPLTVTVLKAEPVVDSVQKNASFHTEADSCNDNDMRKVNSSSVNIEDTDLEPKSLLVEKPKRKYKTKPRKEHVCEICNKKFKHNFLLRNHKRTHTGEKPFTCETCNKSFSQKTTLKYHQRTHTGDKPFNCNICHKPFAYKTHLVEHIRIHTGENPYSCKVCNKRFKRKTHLSLHELTHMDKPYTCKTCNKKFTQKILLTRHERIHTGEKPFTCDTCKKQFSEKSNLRKHIRVHSGEKPYFCITCGNRFSRKYHLNAHELIHVRDMPHSCDVCKKRFRLKSNWRKHTREHRNFNR